MNVTAITNRDIMEAIEALMLHNQERFDTIDQRFNVIDQRFDQIDLRLDSLETQNISLSREMREVKSIVEGFDSRLLAQESDIKEIYSYFPVKDYEVVAAPT